MTEQLQRRVRPGNIVGQRLRLGIDGPSRAAAVETQAVCQKARDHKQRWHLLHVEILHPFRCLGAGLWELRVAVNVADKRRAAEQRAVIARDLLKSGQNNKTSAKM